MLAEEIEKYNHGHVFHQTLAANVRAHNRALEYTLKQYAHDIAFVGSLYSEKSPYRKAQAYYPDKLRGYLDGIMSVQEQLYGSWVIENEEVLPDSVVNTCVDLYPEFYHNPFEKILNNRTTLAQLYLGNEITARERTHTFKKLSEQFSVSIYSGSEMEELPNVKAMGFANSVTEMPLIFNQSKIVINTTSKPIRSGIPLRVFDILSSRGFCLSNYQQELEEYFRPDEELVLYESIEDLIDKCRYYLENENRRKEIAYAGWQRVTKSFTYEKAITVILTKSFQTQ